MYNFKLVTIVKGIFDCVQPWKCKSKSSTMSKIVKVLKTVVTKGNYSAEGSCIGASEKTIKFIFDLVFCTGLKYIIVASHMWIQYSYIFMNILARVRARELDYTCKLHQPIPFHHRRAMHPNSLISAGNITLMTVDRQTTQLH